MNKKIKLVNRGKRTFSLTRDLTGWDRDENEMEAARPDEWLLWELPVGTSMLPQDEYGNFDLSEQTDKGEVTMEYFEEDCGAMRELLRAFGIPNIGGTQVRITIETASPETALDRAKAALGGNAKQRETKLRELIDKFEEQLLDEV